MKSGDFRDILDECSKILDENVNILSDIEFEIDSEKEDVVKPMMTKNELVDMAHDIAESVRIKKAESSFVRRHFENSL
ncbi:MAG: hypothetical protein ACREBI_00090 [Nitrosotalea sp.]